MLRGLVQKRNAVAGDAGAPEHGRSSAVRECWACSDTACSNRSGSSSSSRTAAVDRPVGVHATVRDGDGLRVVVEQRELARGAALVRAAEVVLVHALPAAAERLLAVLAPAEPIRLEPYAAVPPRPAPPSSTLPCWLLWQQWHGRAWDCRSQHRRQRHGHGERLCPRRELLHVHGSRGSRGSGVLRLQQLQKHFARDVRLRLWCHCHWNWWWWWLGCACRATGWFGWAARAVWHRPGVAGSGHGLRLRRVATPLCANLGWARLLVPRAVRCAKPAGRVVVHITLLHAQHLRTPNVFHDDFLYECRKVT